MAEFLAKKKANKDIFVLNYSFEADQETVFGMWTNPAHLQGWLPPKGFEMEFMRSNIQEGCSTFYRMFNQDGLEIYGRTTYLQIAPCRLIVMRQDFCDQHENLARHPLAPELPQTILTTVQFCQEDHGTRVTLTSIGGGSATAKEINRFLAEREGMSRGWESSLEKLEKKLN